MSENALAMFDNAGMQDVDMLDKFKTGLTTTAAKTDGGGSLDGCDLLKMGKNDGEWVFGIDNDFINDEDRLVINIMQLKHGYIDWDEGSVAGESMDSVMRPLPKVSDLGEAKGEKGWQEQLQFDGRLFEDDHETPLRYKQNSQGGREAIRGICKAVVEQLTSEEEYIFPAISLSSTSYDHKQYGKIHKPVFTIEFWVNVNGEKQPKKAKRIANKKTEVEQEDTQEEAPKRRRRKG